MLHNNAGKIGIPHGRGLGVVFAFGHGGYFKGFAVGDVDHDILAALRLVGDGVNVGRVNRVHNGIFTDGGKVNVAPGGFGFGVVILRRDGGQLGERFAVGYFHFGDRFAVGHEGKAWRQARIVRLAGWRGVLAHGIRPVLFAQIMLPAPVVAFCVPDLAVVVP